MISSQEFHQKLQAGQIHEALALVVRDTSELEIVTQMTETSLSSSQSASSEYLRTKINLITGEIHNEVGKDLVANDDNYCKLQQLHTDRIVASHRLVQGYLRQIETILTIVSPPQLETRSSLDNNERLDSASLATLLHRSISPSIDRAAIPKQPEDPVPENSIFTEYDSAPLPDRSHTVELSPSPPVPTDPISPLALEQPLWSENSDPTLAFDEPMPTLAGNPTQLPLIDTLSMDDDLDLSIDEDGEVWEEWVEDDDFLGAALPQSPSVSAASSLPNWQDRLVRRHLHPIDVKPISPRATAEAVDPLPQWDKFEPEYIGISSDDPQQRHPSIDPDSARMNKLLADLDI